MKKEQRVFTKVLVATDLSQASERVVCALAGLRPLGARQALLVHCLNIRDAGGLGHQLIALSRPALLRQQGLLREAGFETEARIVLGLPHLELNRIAEEAGCSLIVVGSHGGTMASEILLGGVASAVINSAVKPVLLVRLRLREKEGAAVCEGAELDPRRHLLFATDFSDNAERAFHYVQEIGEAGARRVTLLHVQDEVRLSRHLRDRLEEFNRIDTERLERLKTDLEKHGVTDVRIELPYGSPKKEIIERTRGGDVSLVVMGSQGRGFLAEMFLGSVSLAVARRSEVPVLLVPAAS